MTRHSRRRGWQFFLLLAVSSLIFTGLTFAQEESKFSLNGSLENETGIFISNNKDRYEVLNSDDEVVRYTGDPNDYAPGEKIYPVNHGVPQGSLSIMRSTLLLEADWKASDSMTMHAIFRATRSMMLDADAEAQVPFPDDISDPERWVRDTFYNTVEVRELYADFELTREISLRVGRQQIAWGDTGQYRLLDIINPIDGTWHFASFESFEDMRKPLWIADALVDFPDIDGSLEFVWIPLLDNPADTVNTPLTIVGAWGLPTPPQQQFEGLTKRNRYFEYPGGGIDDSRLGLRWKGTIGNLTYSLVYFYTHQMSPPIPYKAVQPNIFEQYNEPGQVGEWVKLADFVDVYLKFPRQHIAGFTLDYTFNFPISTVVRLEGSIEPNRTFPVYLTSNEQPPYWDPDSGQVFPEEEGYPMDSKYMTDYSVDWIRKLPYQEKTAINYALVLSRSFFWRFLNRQEGFMVVAQLMQTYLVDFNENEHLMDIPGYDSTALTEGELPGLVSSTLVFALLTKYYHGRIKPVIAAAIDPRDSAKTGFVSAKVGFDIGNNWQITTGLNELWSKDPYKGIGLFRDRDEVFMKVQYLF
jgi:hypothetical protein